MIACRPALRGTTDFSAHNARITISRSQQKMLDLAYEYLTIDVRAVTGLHVTIEQAKGKLAEIELGSQRTGPGRPEKVRHVDRAIEMFYSISSVQPCFVS